MNLLGFLALLGGLAVAPMLGIPEMVFAAAQNARRTGVAAFDWFREKFQGIVVRPTRGMLLVAGAVQLFAYILGWIILSKIDGGKSFYGAHSFGGLILAGFIAAQWWEAWRIRVCEPAYMSVPRDITRLVRAHVASVTADEIAIEGDTSLEDLGFPRRGAVTVDGVAYTYRGLGGNDGRTFLNVTPAPNAGANPVLTGAIVQPRIMTGGATADTITVAGNVLLEELGFPEREGIILVNGVRYDYQETRDLTFHGITAEQNNVPVTPLTATPPVIPGTAVSHAGTEIELDRYPGYDPTAFSFSRALTLTSVVFAALGLYFVLLGILANSTLLSLLGSASILSVLVVIRVMSFAIAWVLRTTSDLVEKILSLAAEQGLVALYTVTFDNLRQVFQGVNLIEQERRERQINQLAVVIAKKLWPFLTIVSAWPYGSVALLVIAFMLGVGGGELYHIWNGGTQEVEEGRYRFSRWFWKYLRWIAVTSVIVRVLWPFFPIDFREAVLGIVTFPYTVFIGVSKGQVGLPFARWWQNILFPVVMGVLTLILWNVGSKKSTRVGVVVAAIPFVLLVWSIFGLGMNILGVKEIRAKRTPAAGPKATPTVTVVTPPQWPPMVPPPRQTATTKPRPVPRASKPKSLPASTAVAKARPGTMCTEAYIKQYQLATGREPASCVP